VRNFIRLKRSGFILGVVLSVIAILMTLGLLVTSVVRNEVFMVSKEQADEVLISACEGILAEVMSQVRLEANSASGGSIFNALRMGAGAGDVEIPIKLKYSKDFESYYPGLKIEKVNVIFGGKKKFEKLLTGKKRKPDLVGYDRACYGWIRVEIVVSYRGRTKKLIAMYDVKVTPSIPPVANSVFCLLDAVHSKFNVWKVEGGFIENQFKVMERFKPDMKMKNFRPLVWLDYDWRDALAIDIDKFSKDPLYWYKYGRKPIVINVAEDEFPFFFLEKASIFYKKVSRKFHYPSITKVALYGNLNNYYKQLQALFEKNSPSKSKMLSWASDEVPYVFSKIVFSDAQLFKRPVKIDDDYVLPGYVDYFASLKRYVASKLRGRHTWKEDPLYFDRAGFVAWGYDERFNYGGAENYFGMSGWEGKGEKYFQKCVVLDKGRLRMQFDYNSLSSSASVPTVYTTGFLVNVGGVISDDYTGPVVFPFTPKRCIFPNQFYREEKAKKNLVSKFLGFFKGIFNKKEVSKFTPIYGSRKPVNLSSFKVGYDLPRGASGMCPNVKGTKDEVVPAPKCFVSHSGDYKSYFQSKPILMPLSLIGLLEGADKNSGFVTPLLEDMLTEEMASHVFAGPRQFLEYLKMKGYLINAGNYHVLNLAGIWYIMGCPDDMASPSEANTIKLPSDLVYRGRGMIISTAGSPIKIDGLYKGAPYAGAAPVRSVITVGIPNTKIAELLAGPMVPEEFRPSPSITVTQKPVFASLVATLPEWAGEGRRGGNLKFDPAGQIDDFKSYFSSINGLDDEVVSLFKDMRDLSRGVNIWGNAVLGCINLEALSRGGYLNYDPNLIPSSGGASSVYSYYVSVSYKPFYWKIYAEIRNN